MFNRSLVLYDSTNHLQRIASLLVKENSTATDFVDVNGSDDTVGTDEIYTLVDALTDNTYDKCYIFCAVSDGGGASTLSYDTYALIRSKLATGSKGTLVVDGDCQSNANTALIVLEATESAVDDAYNDMIIETTGTTEVVKRILDYTGATKTVEIGGAAAGTAITTTEDYAVYNMAGSIYEINATVGGKTIVLLTYENLFPDVGIPKFIQAAGLYMFFEDYGQAQAVAAGTITLATATGDGRRCGTGKNSDDYFNGMTVYVYSSTNGKYQKAVISDYVGSTKVATLSANWTVTPTGTVQYRIKNSDTDQLNEVYWDLAVERYADLMLQDVTDVATQRLFSQLIDKRNNLTTRQYASGQMDRNVELDALAKGKFVVEWQRDNP